MNCEQLIFTGVASGPPTYGKLSTAARIIIEYHDDKPLPSAIILGFVERRPLHVLVARADDGICYVITVYVADPEEWTDGFDKRR